MVACLAALLSVGGGAGSSVNVIGKFFDKVKDKGFPIGGLAYKDGTAQIDVYKDEAVTRYTFDKEGKIEAAPSPLKYDKLAIKTARLSAAAAAASAASHPPDGVEVRSVSFEGSGTAPEYVVGVYDKNGDYHGKHRFNATDGQWDGYEDALGERSPLEKLPAPK